MSSCDLRRRLAAPSDLASLALFRMAFGAILSVSSLRFMLNGWVERFFVERTFFFKYWGFGWVEVLSREGMYGLYSALVVLGLCIALGLFYRVAIVLFFIGFTYAELIDVTNYLNHYYLVSLLTLLASFMPLHACWSLDVLRGAVERRSSVPTWMLYLLRFQVGTVYFYAAIAKCVGDFLLHGQPLNLWLSAQVDVPWIGPWLGRPELAVLASWAGFLHDLTIVPLLLYRRTRPWAYGLLLLFHLTTSTWFNIGIFPVLMPTAATLFFDPSWPRVAFAFVARRATVRLKPSALGLASFSGARAWCVAAYCLVQVCIPLRTFAYPGNVLWHEQGMRWSWRVMLRDKHGAIQYRVRLSSGREVTVPPSRYLTVEQEREMSGQPDLILQLAHHIERDFAARGMPEVGVFVDARVSLNGRGAEAMIDPTVDLTKVRDGIRVASWILPAPDEPPSRLAPRSPALLSRLTSRHGAAIE